MRDLETKSQIYDTTKISTDHKMYQYFTEINRAALKLSVDNPQLLQDKSKLQQAAREYIHSNGYVYKKKNSRSKQFGVAGENKRPYLQDALKVKKIKEIQEDMSDTDTQMALLTRQREKHINVKQFGQAATITDQLSQLRGKKRQLENELTLLQNKRKLSSKQKAKKPRKAAVSETQGLKITDMLNTETATSTTIDMVSSNPGTPESQTPPKLSSIPATSELKEKDLKDTDDPFLTKVLETC